MSRTALADPVIQPIAVTGDCASLPLNPAVRFAVGFIIMAVIGVTAFWVGAKPRSARTVTHIY